jgi:hypothetical protein
MSDPLKPLFGGLPDGVDRLARRAQAAATLTDQVRAALPEVLRTHVIGANARGTELVVIVDSAAWAARVRYAARRLREALAAADAAGFEKLRVRVGAPVPSPAVPSATRKLASPS